MNGFTLDCFHEFLHNKSKGCNVKVGGAVSIFYDPKRLTGPSKQKLQLPKQAEFQTVCSRVLKMVQEFIYLDLLCFERYLNFLLFIYIYLRINQRTVLCLTNRFLNLRNICHEYFQNAKVVDIFNIRW